MGDRSGGLGLTIVAAVMAVAVLGFGGAACLGAGVVGLLSYQVDQQRAQAVSQLQSMQQEEVRERLELVRQRIETEALNGGVPLELDGTEPAVGSPSARNRIVVFSDFGCPHCAQAWERLREEAASGRVRVIHKAYPLSKACNPAIDRPGRDERCRMALAAECAHALGAFDAFSEDLFREAARIDGDAVIFEIAEDSGLDVTALRACMDDPATGLGLAEDVAAGKKVGVVGTPQLYAAHGSAWVPIEMSDLDALLAD